jgi:hypothetical protein
VSIYSPPNAIEVHQSSTSPVSPRERRRDEVTSVPVRPRACPVDAPWSHFAKPSPGRRVGALIAGARDRLALCRGRPLL